jgi:HK97 family phage major capsid protein
MEGALALIEIAGRMYDSAEVIRARIEELDAEYPGQTFPDEAREEWNELNRVLDEFKAREDRIRELARDPRNIESGGELGSPHIARDHDAGLRTIERYRNDLSAEAGDRLEELVRRRDPSGIDARYLGAVGDPAYNSAFGKMLMDPTHGHLRFTSREIGAVQAVNAVEIERGLVSGVGAQGGFAIPFTLDPSVILTSSGALNPIRRVARSITIATREWKGVSSAGVTASYDAEASEVSDDTPTLAQPTSRPRWGVPSFPSRSRSGWTGAASRAS